MLRPPLELSCGSLLLLRSADARSLDDVIAFEGTPLHLAVVQSHPGTIALLLAAGASPDIEDDDGYSPASEAAEIGDPDVLEVLGLLPVV